MSDGSVPIPTDQEPLCVPSVFLNEAIFAFLISFLLTPFSTVGYLFVFTLIALEIFTLFYYAEPRCYPTRMFVIFVTVFGRLIGEVCWNLILHHGRNFYIKTSYYDLKKEKT